MCRTAISPSILPHQSRVVVKKYPPENHQVCTPRGKAQLIRPSRCAINAALAAQRSPLRLPSDSRQTPLRWRGPEAQRKRYGRHARVTGFDRHGIRLLGIYLCLVILADRVTASHFAPGEKHHVGTLLQFPGCDGSGPCSCGDHRFYPRQRDCDWSKSAECASIKLALAIAKNANVSYPLQEDNPF
jgi:hypothetical protein